MKPLNRTTAQITSDRKIKVLQFGTGNFLRGFVDWVIDILNEKSAFDGDIQIVQPHGKTPAIMLNSQEGLYHVLTRGFQNNRVVDESRLISSVRGAINPFLDYGDYLKLAENPELRFVVSNTTEAGIVFDSRDADREQAPLTFPGKLTALLYRRFVYFEGKGDKGLILIPCELIEDNGVKLKEAVLQYAGLWRLPEDFTRWVTDRNIFCNTLVDRIVPGFPEEDSETIQQSLGYKDELMVVAEPFHFWAIEGPAAVAAEFPADTVGLDIVFVKDLKPYRERKVRILNGAHTTLVPLAYLKGFRTVREAVEDKSMGDFIKSAIQEEIIPTLDLPKEELDQFASDVLERFKNPFIRHMLSAIALNSISKWQVRVLPSLLEYVKRKDTLPLRLVQAFAALIVFYRGRYKGEDLPVKDSAEITAFFIQAWQKRETAEMVEEILAHKTLWGRDLNTVSGLKARLTREVEELLDREN